MANGKKFSIDFQQAQEIENTTQILIQSEGWPVQKATLEQIGRALINGNIVPSITGNYPKMSVGFAENVVGDGSTTAEVFSFRPTAGVNRNTLNDGAARIHTLKGNSVVWNQSAQVRTDTVTKYGISVTNDGVKSTVIGTAEALTNISLATATIAANHKCLLGGCPSNGSASTFYFSDGLGNRDYGQGVIFTTTEAHSDTWMNFTVVQGTTVDFVIYPVLYDLTLMFGAGNEPATVEEFYQRLPIGVDINAYNAGDIVDGHYGAVKTTGFNQWDEQWEQGAFDYYTGNKIADNSRIRSKNYIPVIPNTFYYYKMPSSWQVCYWDADKQFIIASQNSGDVAEKTPQNCHYITFNVGYSGDPITDYNNNICISLYWPTEYGNLYGTYKPYKPFERDLSWGAKYFPNGMRSAGNIADEIRFNSTTQQWEAVKRVSVVDLGSLMWGMQADSNVFTTTIVGIAPADTHEKRQNGILCEKYGISPNTSVDTSMQDGSILRFLSGVAIRDTAFPSSADFTTAMQGVMLNYELAEPVITPITENVNFDFDVSDYGTEELIVAEGAQSAPLSADIEYSPNVLAVLKNAPGIANDVDMLKSQLSAITAQLATLTLNNN